MAGLLFVDPRKGLPAFHDAHQPLCDRLLRPAEARQEHADGVADLVGDLGALGSFVNLDEDIVCLKLFLSRIARLTVGGTATLDS